MKERKEERKEERKKIENIYPREQTREEEKKQVETKQKIIKTPTRSE